MRQKQNEINKSPRFFLNDHVYAKQKINLTWPKGTQGATLGENEYFLVAFVRVLPPF